MSLFLNNGKLLANSGGIAATDSCCCPPPPPITPSLCCRNRAGVNDVPTVAFLEVEILNFTSSRGNFTDFDIAGPHLVPAEFPNATTGAACSSWVLEEYITDQTLWESAFSGPLATKNFFDQLVGGGTCGIVSPAEVEFVPDTRPVIPLAPENGTPWVRTKNITLTDSNMTVSFQSRTSSFSNQLTRFTDFNFSFSGVISSIEFYSRACLRTLDISLSRSGIVGWTQGPPTGFGPPCTQNSAGGTFSYTVRVRSSELQ